MKHIWKIYKTSCLSNLLLRPEQNQSTPSLSILSILVVMKNDTPLSMSSLVMIERNSFFNIDDWTPRKNEQDLAGGSWPCRRRYKRFMTSTSPLAEEPDISWKARRVIGSFISAHNYIITPFEQFSFGPFANGGSLCSLGHSHTCDQNPKCRIAFTAP